MEEEGEGAEHDNDVKSCLAFFTVVVVVVVVVFIIVVVVVVVFLIGVCPDEGVAASLDVRDDFSHLFDTADELFCVLDLLSYSV